MATPTPDEIRSTLERHVQFWNEGRFDDLIALWPDDVELDDPVGTPVKVGKQAAFIDNWNHSHGAGISRSPTSSSSAMKPP